MRRRLCQICFIKFWSFSAISALFMAFRSQIHVQKSFIRNSKILSNDSDPRLFEVFKLNLVEIKTSNTASPIPPLTFNVGIRLDLPSAMLAKLAIITINNLQASFLILMTIYGFQVQRIFRRSSIPLIEFY